MYYPIANLLILTVMVLVAWVLCTICYKARAAPKLAAVFPRPACPPPPDERHLARCEGSEATSLLATFPAPTSIWPSLFGKLAACSKRARSLSVGGERKNAPVKSSDEDCEQSGTGSGDGPSAGFEYDEGPQLARPRRPYGGNRRLYEELVRTFVDAGSRDQALLLKVAIHSRLPGHRRLVDTAFEEACREAFHVA